MMKSRFDIAISFAGPDRSLAREVRDALVAECLNVFFDEDFEHEMFGADGTEYLHSIYSLESRFCLVLISEAYDCRAWAQLEREAIRARELQGEHGVLLPVRLDGHTPLWLPVSRLYFDLQSRSVAELAMLVGIKVRSDKLIKKQLRKRYDELVSQIRPYELGEYERLNSLYQKLTLNQVELLYDLVLRAVLVDQRGLLQKHKITEADLERMAELEIIERSTSGRVCVREPFINWVVENSVQ